MNDVVQAQVAHSSASLIACVTEPSTNRARIEPAMRQRRSAEITVIVNHGATTMDFQSYTDEVQAFVDRGNYHAAINVALSGLNACRRSDDQAGIDRCLALIESVVQQLAGEFGSREYLERQ